MNLNTISLPPQLVADLYPHSLVNETAAAPPLLPPVPALGKGGKGILIVVNKPEVPFLPDGELDFLTKVLTACQLGLADVAIINWHKAPHQDSPAMLEQFRATEVLLFDVNPAFFGLPESLPPFAPYSFQNRQYVVAPALQEIEKTKETKGQLWAALKQVFAL